jgi:hypothetical protein
VEGVSGQGSSKCDEGLAEKGKKRGQNARRVLAVCGGRKGRSGQWKGSVEGKKRKALVRGRAHDAKALTACPGKSSEIREGRACQRG